MTDDLHCDACVNLIALLTLARQAFEAKDFDGAQRKLKAADAVAERVKSRRANRPCTCHPSDNPPVPCPKRYAYSECMKAARSP